MDFEIDSQTQHDLSIISYQGQLSVMRLFTTITFGGSAKLKEIFDHPLNDIKLIKSRVEAIRFSGQLNISRIIDRENLDFIEHYLLQSQREATFSKSRALQKQFSNWVKPSNEYYITERGTRLLLTLIKNIAKILTAHQAQLPSLLNELLKNTNTLLSKITDGITEKERIGAIEIEQLDFIFRYAGVKNVKDFLDSVYTLDVFNAAVNTAATLNFCYPEFIAASTPELTLDEFFHPFIKNPVGNNIGFNRHQNLCFITGANMAGKSTVLKAIGICTFLAHLGFPVPATRMQTTVFNGLFTTINLSDNIMEGHSHFYREVLRIKEVALKTGAIKNILVIFDELFRGTNVKDAYDASLAIIKAFAQVKSSVFMISTHIVEVTDELKQTDNIFFKCLGTQLIDNTVTYSYKLANGISNERLGMRIIEDEGLVEIILKQAH